MKKIVQVSVLAVSALLLSACGGGGGNPGACSGGDETCKRGKYASGSGNTNTASSNSGAVSSAPNICVNPRTGTNPLTGRPYAETQGTKDNEIAFVKAWMDETYLWYKELPSISNPFSYASPVAFFNDYKVNDASRTRHHFTQDASVAANFSRFAGVIGYGLTWEVLSSSPPRKVVVSYTDTQQAPAGNVLERGDEIIEADGVQVQNGDFRKLLVALFPQQPDEIHTFTVKKRDGTETTVTLTSKEYRETVVQRVGAFDAGGKRIGYMQFNTFSQNAEGALITAFNQLKSENVDELVLDLRYNGGGSVPIAASLAYMIAGQANTQGKIFERLVDNDKNPFGDRDYPFYSKANENTGEPLPSLNLSKLYVLSTSGTCSASEAVINGLRGVDVDVEVIGAKTCGKPYAFIPTDNCSTTYYAVQFQGFNNKGFGDFANGFAPTCAVPDDFNNSLGNPSEKLLAAAVYHSANNACPASTAKANGFSIEQFWKPSVMQSSGATGSAGATGGALVDPLYNLRSNQFVAP